MNTTQLSIIVTDEAIIEMNNFLTEDDELTAGIRISVLPGGCSGFKYGMTVSQDAAADDIIISYVNGVRLFIDPFSAQYLDGLIIGYKSSMEGSGFTFKNPNSTGGCGCGSSFAM